MKISLKGITIVLIIIYVGLISFAISLFIIFIFGHEHLKDPFYFNAWSYFDSELFRAILVSFAIPIILLILENKYNIIQDLINLKMKEKNVHYENTLIEEN
jgi:uncharacterized membrane protein YbhN (UPF0104 family)